MLGIEYPDIHKVIVDFAESLIEHGVVPNKKSA